MDSRLQLPVGTVLDGSYRIERLLGFGGFGVTYVAEDFNLGTTVALKEYYPVEFGDRDSTMSVKPKSERHRQTFEWGRTSFLQEARMLARFRHHSIVRVSRVFEAHSTAYMVMDFERGENFEQWLATLCRPPTQEELDRIVAPLLDALELMHEQNFLHRDIAPDNIIVRPDGTPVLLDFGAARQAVAEMSRTLTGIVKAGYSPQEQYATDSRLQGPWSDLYAFGATLYRAIAGRPPEEASLRAGDDRTVPASVAKRGEYRPAFLAAIDACLRIRHAERPQSVAQLRKMMLESAAPPRAAHIEATRVLHNTVAKVSVAAKRNPLRWGLAISALVALFAGSYLGVEYSRWGVAERSKVDVEAQRQTEAAARRDEQARADAEIRRETEERIVEEKRQEATKADADRRFLEEKRFADERARQIAELKKLQEGILAKQNEEETKRQSERAAAEKKAKDEAKARAIEKEKAERQASNVATAETGQIIVDGKPRTFILERPNTNRPSPTIIMLHGANGTAQDIGQRTGLAQQGPHAGFAVAFPQSLASVWNRFSPGKEPPQASELFRQVGGPPNDLAFLKMLVADLTRRGLSDPARVYFAGYSNGGFMTLSMFCSEPNLFAGIGVIISSMPNVTGDACRPAKQIPVVIINGTADVVVPYGGGLVSPLKPLDPSTVSVWSTEQLEAYLRRFNGCTQPPVAETMSGASAQRIEVARSNCPGAPVHLYKVVGGTHTSVATTLNTGSVLLDFFRLDAGKAIGSQPRIISHIMYRRYDGGTLVTGDVRRTGTGEWIETNTRGSKWTFRPSAESAVELVLHDWTRHVYVKMDLTAKKMFVQQGGGGAWTYLAEIVWTDQ